MTRCVIELEDELLAVARAELGTTTVADTVNEALRRIAESRRERGARALDRLAAMEPFDRDEAWR